MKLNCIVVDDEPLAISVLENYIQQTEQLHLVQCFTDSIRAKSFLEQHNIDVLFVDINMPDLNGINLVKQLQKPPVIIFTTAYKKFAYDGYELDAVDYLLKPIELDRFRKAVHKVLFYFQQSEIAPEQLPKHFYVRAEYKLVQIMTNEVDFIEGLEDYIKIHLNQSKPILTLQTLKSIEKQLAPHFVRIHRSYIVPKGKIKTVAAKKVILHSGKELPVSDTYYNDLLKQIHR